MNDDPVWKSPEQRQEDSDKYIDSLEIRITILENALLELANLVMDDHVNGNDIIRALQKAGFNINQGGGFKWLKK